MSDFLLKRIDLELFKIFFLSTCDVGTADSDLQPVNLVQNSLVNILSSNPEHPIMACLVVHAVKLLVNLAFSHLYNVAVIINTVVRTAHFPNCTKRMHFVLSVCVLELQRKIDFKLDEIIWRREKQIAVNIKEVNLNCFQAGSVVRVEVFRMVLQVEIGSACFSKGSSWSNKQVR